MVKANREIVVYTDGGCNLKKNGLGAWAYTIQRPGQEPQEAAMAMWGMTNNKTEMMAVLRALEALEAEPPEQPIVIITDSYYVINGATLWWKSWVQRNWKTYDGDPVKNKELWLQLLAVLDKHNVIFHHVKGHTGVAGNERCDTLCTGAMLALETAEDEA